MLLNLRVSKVSFDHCPRCGGAHESLTVKSLDDATGSREPNDHWCTCPAKLQPVLFRLAPTRAGGATSIPQEASNG